MIEDLALPDGTLLARFEIRSYGDGSTSKTLPCVVWVDANRPLMPSPGGIGCACSGPFYPIRVLPAGRGVNCPSGNTPSVCACMGRFIE